MVPMNSLQAEFTTDCLEAIMYRIITKETFCHYLCSIMLPNVTTDTHNAIVCVLIYCLCPYYFLNAGVFLSSTLFKTTH